MDLLAAQDWHWWIGVVLTPVAVLMVLATALGYVMKVVRPRYPNRRQQQQLREQQQQ